MSRTRKWIYVSQEATRLAELGLKAAAIAERVGVDTSTVTRWFQTGKLSRQPRVKVASGVGPMAVPPMVAGAVRDAAGWAASVRAEYALNETDAQLVALGETALAIAKNPAESPTTVLAAIRTFQGVAKQLTLVAKVVEVAAEAVVDAAPARVVRAAGADPRVGLMVQ